MNFKHLQQNIKDLSAVLRQNAILAVNTHLTIRNWLIGFYIMEFEQNGEDRAAYGKKLLQNLSASFNEEGLSYRNLKLYRQFYTQYPQIKEYIPYFLQKYFGTIGQSPVAQLLAPTKKVTESSLSPTDMSAQIVFTKNMIERLSYTHFTLLLPIEDVQKRHFYEAGCIKGTWSIRELKRQIDTLYFERSGMSKKPELLQEEVQKKSEKNNLADIIKSPFTFEFLGLQAKDVVYESDLEQSLILHLEDFLIELGHGFCFEARQKRIIIGGEYFFCDLVFYHRLLKCHILVELKVGHFSHEHIGQLKTYVNYYKKEIMQKDDNPPIGILLVTNKNQALVEYAISDSDEEIFVSKYLLELPSKQQLADFLKKEVDKN